MNTVWIVEYGSQDFGGGGSETFNGAFSTKEKAIADAQCRAVDMANDNEDDEEDMDIQLKDREDGSSIVMYNGTDWWIVREVPIV